MVPLSRYHFLMCRQGNLLDTTLNDRMILEKDVNGKYILD